MRILAALDLDSHPQTVLRTARSFVEATGGTLDVVYASPELARIPMTEDREWASARAEQRAALEALRDSLPEAIRGSATVLVGHPAEVLPAVTYSYDLIVMATHSRTGLRRLVVGSVTEAVLRTAHCPVLTVRIGADAPPEARGGQID